jgi:hypothetical protein
MTAGRRAASLVLVALVAVAAASRGDDAPLSIHAAVSNAVAEGNVVRTRPVGSGGDRDAFSDVNSRGGVLIGFELGMSEWFGSEIPTAVRPIYRTAGGEVNGKSHGSFTVKQGGVRRVVKLRARAGYAVGAISMRAGGGLDAMMLTYYRISGDRLDPQRSYRSAWVGNLKGGSERSFEGAGMPYVGVFGNKNGDRVHGLGFINVRLPDPPRKAEKPALKPKDEDRPIEKPARAPAEKREQPAKAPGTEKWTHRDAGRGFKVDLPGGWVRLLFVEQQDLLKKAPGLFDVPEAGFRDEKAELGDAFVVLRSRELRPGLSLNDAGRELTPSAGPYREVSGLMRDWARNLQVDEVVVDRARNRFAWRTTGDVAGVGRRGTLFVCYVGAGSAVTMECHAPQALFASTLPTFAQIGESAAFDASKAHKEPPKSSSTWVPMAVFIAVSAVIFVPMAVYFGKRRKQATQKRKKRQAEREDEGEIPYAELAEEPVEAAPLAFAPSTGIVAELPSATPIPPLTPAKKARREERPADDPFTCVGERTYRVYVVANEAYFIDDGPGEVEPAALLLGSVFRDEPKLARDTNAPLGERPTADDLFALADGVTNFRVKSEDVLRAQIEAPGFWDSLGEGVVGTLRFTHHSRGELTFRFRGTTDMKRAIELLRGAWSEILSVHATWDREKKKFVRDA